MTDTDFTAMSTTYYQCRLRRGESETIGWIEERGAKVGASVAEREQQLKDSDRIWRLIRKASGDDVPEPEPVPVPEPEPSFDYYDYGYFG